MQIQFESPPHSDAVSSVITISSRKHPEYSSVTESMTLVDPVPFVTSISPASGSMAGAETVTIDIANFEVASKSEVVVTFGGIEATVDELLFSDATATRVKVTTPSASRAEVRDVSLATSFQKAFTQFEYLSDSVSFEGAACISAARGCACNVSNPGTQPALSLIHI